MHFSVIFLVLPIQAVFRFFNPFSPAEQNSAFANSIDPDEMAHNEPSHQDLHCLPFCFDFMTEYI